MTSYPTAANVPAPGPAAAQAADRSAALRLEAVAFEGSRSLDKPNAVLQ